MRINAEYDDKKDERIMIRISVGDKERYKEEAKKLGMTLSKYITYILDHKGIVMIDGKEELLDAIDELATTVKECISKPSNIQVTPVEDNCPWTYVIPEDSVDN